MVKHMLYEMSKVAGFVNLPVFIEGGVCGEEEKKVGYFNGKFSGMEITV
jgi:hypothetical protein